ADFSSAPMLFRPPGCEPLLAMIHKRGTVFVYRRHAIDAGPVETIQVGDPNQLEASGTFAWSARHQTLYVTNSSARLHGIVALRVSGCMLVEAWRRDLGRDMSPPSSPTVAGNVVYYG